MSLYLGPEAHILESYFHANHTWKKVLGEWIDNAFDQEARSISFEFSHDWLRISDDGQGCNDLAAMLKLGSHVKTASTKLGRYGIGGKDAALWVGGLDSMLTIKSVHSGRARKVSVRWRQLIANSWTNSEDITEQPAESDEGGTTILINNIARKVKSGADTKKLLSELGYLYFAALKLGYQIKVKFTSAKPTWQPIVRWEPPAFDGPTVAERISVNGRGATVVCGVVKNGVANERRGFTYTHGWRVVKEASAYGCGDHSIARICGFVELDESWKLTRNKDDISQGADELYAAVEQVCKDTLRRGDQVASELQSSAFESACSNVINAMFCRELAKAKRHPGEIGGLVEPTFTNAPHKRAKVEQDGERFRSHRGAGGFRLEFYEEDNGEIGKFTLPNRVMLNSRHPFVNRYRDSDQALIVALAGSLLADFHSSNFDGAPLLRGFPSTFNASLGRMLSAADLALDGTRILSSVVKRA